MITGTPITAGSVSFAVTAMDSESPVAQASQTLTLAVNPPPRAAVWVTDGGDNLIHSFPLAASGSASPSATIGGSATGLNSLGGIAVDKTGAVYASNTATPSIAVFAPGTSGNVVPGRTIAGPNTGLSAPAGIALDNAGLLYVADEGDNAITVYAAGAHGDARPVQTISGLDTELGQPTGVVVDSAGHVWAASASANLLTEYAAGANGDAVPIGTYRGLATTLNDPAAVALDASGRVVVANTFGESVSAFTGAPPFGNVTPAFTISGSQSQLSYPRGLDIDNAGNLYVANQFGGINVYTPNTTAPLRVIAGAATGLASPHALAVAPPLGIATTSLPTAALEREYTARLIANLATAPSHWRIARGHLPQGLTLSGAGQISGQARQLGVFRFTVADVDSTKQAMHASGRLTLRVGRSPIVTGLRPARGGRRSLATVTITGSGFATAPGATVFAFGRLRALDAHCRTHTLCTAQAPPHPAAAVDVTATVHGLVSRRTHADRYVYRR